MRSKPNWLLFVSGYNLGMKVTLRELFLLTVVVALVIGWWLDNRRLSAIAAAAKEQELVARTRAAMALEALREFGVRRVR